MDFSISIGILSAIFLFIVLISFFNEKVVKLPEEIGFLAISLLCSMTILVFELTGLTSIRELVSQLGKVDFHGIVLGGFICYLLFAGSVKIQFDDLADDKYLISSLAFVSTFISTLVYAGMAMVFTQLIDLPLTWIDACILGSIIAPTDPISAMSILNKVGLSKRLSLIVEGESLFNDGIAVALFATFSSIKKTTPEDIAFEFIATISWEIAGALIVGFLTSYLLMKIFEHTKQKYLEILISLTAVSIAYSISEYIHVSGVIASVVVGLYFASKMNQLHKDSEVYYSKFHTFWHVIDKFLNATLYIMMGLVVLFISNISGSLLIAIAAILMSLIARFVSIIIPVNLFSKKHSVSEKKYTEKVRKKDVVAMIKLLTWAGLKGGICMALALGSKNLFKPEQYNFVVISTYAVVVFSTLVQGLTVKQLYYRIKGHLI